VKDVVTASCDHRNPLLELGQQLIPSSHIVAVKKIECHRSTDILAEFRILRPPIYYAFYYSLV